MNIKQALIGVFAAMLTFGFAGSAIASSDLISPHSSEAGVYQFSFDTPQAKADKAAINYDYDPQLLSRVGTEGGNWEYRFNAPETKADIAAKNHAYDMEQLSEVGTEGGNWQYRFDSKGYQSVSPACGKC